MESIKSLLDAVRGKLSGTALKDAVVSKPLSAGNRHVLVLSEVSVAFGAGGGAGEAAVSQRQPSKGKGGGAGGVVKAGPVAVLVVEDGKARIETLG